MTKLLDRPRCPSCYHEAFTEVFRGAYSGEQIRSYMIEYYELGKRGKIEEYDNLTRDADFVLNECKNCRLIYQEKVPDESFSSTLYSEWIYTPEDTDNDSAILDFTERKHYVGEAMRLIGMTLRLTGKSNPNDLNILDYGLGMGGLASAMRGCGAHVYGFDFSDTRQDRGNSMGLKMLSYEQIAKMKFDLINTEGVFEHLPEPGIVAEYLSSSLRPSGVLKITVPLSKELDKGDYTINWRPDSREIKHSPIPVHPLEHLNYFRKPSMQKMAERLELRRVHFSRKEFMQYSLEWFSPKGAARNLGRMFALEKLRNYYLFQKKP